MQTHGPTERVGPQPKARVLLVDDNPLDLKYYGTSLRAGGYEVVTCGSVTDGVGRLGEGMFDFVIVSQGSPQFEERSVLERVVETNHRLPTLVLTRRFDMASFLEAMHLCAVDYLESRRGVGIEAKVFGALHTPWRVTAVGDQSSGKIKRAACSGNPGLNA